MGAGPGRGRSARFGPRRLPVPSPVGTSTHATWGATGAVCALGGALAAPEWAPRRWTAEDGVVEWTGFACFLAAAILAFVAASRARPARHHVLAAATLGTVLLIAAGEEISWGQRLLELETPGVLVDGNRQDELNLHNVDGLQQKAVLAQLAVAGGGMLLPRLIRRPWARAGLPFFAGYLAYRGGRAVAAVAGWAPAGDNAEAAELVLAIGLLALTAHLVHDLRRPGAHAVATLSPSPP